MNDSVERIAATVLYEGYVLWPYRRSAGKNQRRWTFGGVYPRRYSDGGHSDDPWLMQTQCLVTGEQPAVEIQVRFLHVVERQVSRRNVSGGREPVDELRVGDTRYLSWDEAREREVRIDGLRLAGWDEPRRVDFAFPSGREEEPILTAEGEPAGALLRTWQTIAGSVEVDAEHLEGETTRLTVRIANTTDWSGGNHEEAVRRALVSTHTILRVAGGEFVSLLDPPLELKHLAEACTNVKTWPVLVGEMGEEGERQTLLSSPIILYDYPQTAPESAGDLFDGTEIDELLVLNILALTDAEKDEMRATDPRSRQILERTEALAPEDFMRLHGTIREMAWERAGETADPFLFGLEKPAPAKVRVNGGDICRGSRVRLRPRAGGDIMDLALAGKVAVVAAIEQDYEETIHVAVTLEDDPGRDLGEERQIGHRFFFSVDEVELLAEGGL